jgi:RNA polymerase sigma-70 factor (ECF subfamily)
MRMDNGEGSYRRFLDGDESGFDELVEMYREPLINFINGFLHNPSESEDVAEDAFVELIVHPGRYSFRSSLKTYLFSVARNKAVDRVRREKKYYSSPIDELDMADTDMVEECIFSKENGEKVRVALERINPEYSAILRLIYIEGMTSEEAAAVMKKSKKQIANLTYRAKQSLKRAMEKGGFSYEK